MLVAVAIAFIIIALILLYTDFGQKKRLNHRDNDDNVGGGDSQIANREDIPFKQEYDAWFEGGNVNVCGPTDCLSCPDILKQQRLLDNSVLRNPFVYYSDEYRALDYSPCNESGEFILPDLTAISLPETQITTASTPDHTPLTEGY